MAEGILRHLGGNRVEVHSAGTVATRVHPLAIAAMAEKNVDIRGQRSKHLDVFARQRFDEVISLCDLVREARPAVPGGAESTHWSMADPSAAHDDGEAAGYPAFRQTAAELVTRIGFLLAAVAHRRTAA